MKMMFNKYVYFLALLLVNTFATLQANEFNASSSFDTLEFCENTLQNSPVVTDNTSAYETVAEAYHQHKNPFLFCEIAEGSETEDKKVSFKKAPSPYKFLSNEGKILAFSTAQLFESFSNELQKNIHRPHKVVHKSNVRLHQRYQVFII